MKFGRKRMYDKHQIQEIMSKRNDGQGYGTIARAFGISRATIQTIVKRELEVAA